MKKSFLSYAWAGIISSVMSLSVSQGFAHAQSLGKGTWETDLVGRDLDGDVLNGFEAYYDKALNITWLANANYAKSVGVGDYGVLSSSEASSWAESVTVYGTSAWRLPTIVDEGSIGCEWSFGGTECGYNVVANQSELAHMFHVTLGNSSRYDEAGLVQAPSLSLNWGPFMSVGEPSFGHAYLSTSTRVQVPGAYSSWLFDMRYGVQNTVDVGEAPGLVWLVRSGDVAAVPEPNLLVTVLSGILVLAFAFRKRRDQF